MADAAKAPAPRADSSRSLVEFANPFKLPTLLSPEQTAAAIGVSVATLATWRCTKRYPLSYVKTGRLVRYREEDVLAFINSGFQKVTER